MSERARRGYLWVGALVLSMMLLGGVPVGGAESPIGKWKTVDDKTGTEPNNEQGKPKTCTKCPGADKDKPIVGLVIVRDLSLNGDRYKGGTIMDPEDGKVYKAELWSEDGKLKVRGYLGVFYKTQTWVMAQ